MNRIHQPSFTYYKDHKIPVPLRKLFESFVACGMDISTLMNPLFPWLSWEELGRMTLVYKKWYNTIITFCRVVFRNKLHKSAIQTTMEATGFPVAQKLMISGESLVEAEESMCDYPKGTLQTETASDRSTQHTGSV